MTSTFIHRLHFLLLLLFFPFCLTAEDTPSREIRLGVLAYADFNRDALLLKEIVNDINKRSSPSIKIKIALGTYSDLAHWMGEGYIDAALVNAGVAAPFVKNEGEWEYLLTDTHLDKVTGAKYSRCVVPEHSPIKNVADAVDALKKGTTRLFLVDPFSIAGGIAPLYALKDYDIPKDAIEYTHSHSNALRYALKDSGIACVWQKALEECPEASKLRTISLPSLENLTIPRSILLGKRGASLESFKAALLKLRSDDFTIDSKWNESVVQTESWEKEIRESLIDETAGLVPLSDVISSLLHYSNSALKTPRLAVVLAGGGAKCSFQVGALRALEEALAEAQAHGPNPDLAIKLVVGTSGGAINALSAAMGLSATHEGNESFKRAWLSLDQREIISPSLFVRWSLVLWTFAIECLLLSFIANLSGFDPRDRLGIPRIPSILLGLTQILVITLIKDPWSMLGFSPLLHKVWLWFNYAGFWAGCGLILLGLLTGGSVWLNRISILSLIPCRRNTTILLLLTTFFTPAILTWNILFREETLSSEYGIESAITRNFTALVNEELRRRKLTELDFTGSSVEDTMKSLSTTLIKKNLLVRDLVLTASPLSNPENQVPGELYFYASALNDNLNPPHYGERGVALNTRPEILLDVLMGSGSIYPVFPARHLPDFPNPGEGVDLVDGSFAHRSPIEAAILWGATHIIVLEASAESLTPRGNFISNIAAALNYLYDEAQLTDARSRGQVTIFSLVPQNSETGLLDFADNFIKRGIEEGYREAIGTIEGQSRGVPTWRKELGRPVFW